MKRSKSAKLSQARQHNHGIHYTLECYVGKRGHFCGVSEVNKKRREKIIEKINETIKIYKTLVREELDGIVIVRQE